MDPVLAALDDRGKALREELDQATKLASDRYADFNRAKDDVESKGADLLTDDDAFGAIKAKHDHYRKASEKAEQIRASYMRHLERATGEAKIAGGDDFGTALAEGFKSLLEGSGSGSFIAPPQFLPRVWDRLRPQSVGLLSGFTVLTSENKEVHLPRVTADATAAWVAEGGTISASDPTIDEVVVIPRKVAALNQYSSELLMDSSPEVGEMILRHFLTILGAKLDLGFFEGSGTAPEIRGLKNVSGISTVSMGTNGSTPTNLDAWADALGTLAEANAEGTAIVMHPRTWRTLSKIKEASGSAKPVLQESAGSAGQGIDRRIYGVPVFLTSQLAITESQGTSTDASSSYVYQADQIVAVRREEFRFEANAAPLFSSDMWQVRGIMRWGLAVPNPPAVCRILGLRP